MAVKELGNLAVSIFCRNMSMLISAGIDAEESVGLLADDAAANDFRDAAKAVQNLMLTGQPQLSAAMLESGYFPSHACKMLAAGEKTGKSESVLRSLADYYESRDRLARKMKSAVNYPMILLILTAAILVLLLVRVLPVFTNVYRSLAGGLTTSAYIYLRVAYIVGTVALILAIVFGIFLLLTARTVRGNGADGSSVGLLSRFGPAKDAISKLSLAHFTQVLHLFVASGADVDTSITAAQELVSDPVTKAKVDAVRTHMKEDNVGLSRAIYDKGLFEPLYARLFMSAVKAGQTEQMLGKLANSFSLEADEAVDSLIDSIEPVISAFLTIAVGIVLLSTMIPLIGILGAV
ncbi:MAG: type II secretion system F family protein [Lachnospiraceae bacterium]|jgi:type II secretory pathway component PulF|nr:type II secretion system F family protein [Lachnospiraceae bacterium]